ncbi:MAG: Lrp/AsnC family transcriptional regulator [Nitratireductor sp.]|nr:Lrp/AsnC family transcriptional regulator [Nitratireductor sp.]MCC0020063.1 Lrp/AsnC family transcriptional regulator [Nitratireductor sp.]
MKEPELDDIDLNILRILQAEPEITIEEVGTKVGLSHTPCWRRIRKMQDSGLLKGRVWLVDAEKAGRDVSIFVFVRLETHSTEVMDAFETATLGVPEILQCYTVSGEFDYMLRVVVASVRDYERTVKGKLLKLPHVGIMNSHFALNEVKNTTVLPV